MQFLKNFHLIQQRIEVAMNAVIAAVQPMLDGYGAHAAFTPFPLDVARQVTPGAE